MNTDDKKSPFLAGIERPKLRKINRPKEYNQIEQVLHNIDTLGDAYLEAAISTTKVIYSSLESGFHPIDSPRKTLRFADQATIIHESAAAIDEELQDPLVAIEQESLKESSSQESHTPSMSPTFYARKIFSQIYTEGTISRLTDEFIRDNHLNPDSKNSIIQTYREQHPQIPITNIDSDLITKLSTKITDMERSEQNPTFTAAVAASTVKQQISESYARALKDKISDPIKLEIELKQEEQLTHRSSSFRDPVQQTRVEADATFLSKHQDKITSGKMIVTRKSISRTEH